GAFGDVELGGVARAHRGRRRGRSRLAEQVVAEAAGREQEAGGEEESGGAQNAQSERTFLAAPSVCAEGAPGGEPTQRLVQRQAACARLAAMQGLRRADDAARVAPLSGTSARSSTG